MTLRWYLICIHFIFFICLWICLFTRQFASFTAAYLSVCLLHAKWGEKKIMGNVSSIVSLFFVRRGVGLCIVYDNIVIIVLTMNEALTSHLSLVLSLSDVLSYSPKWVFVLYLYHMLLYYNITWVRVPFPREQLQIFILYNS